MADDQHSNHSENAQSEEFEIKCKGIQPQDPIGLLLFVGLGGTFLFADFSLAEETTFVLNVLFLFAWTSDVTLFTRQWIKKRLPKWRRMLAPLTKIVTPCLPAQVMGIFAVFHGDDGRVFLAVGWVWAFLMHFVVNYKYEGRIISRVSWDGVVSMFVDFMMGLFTRVWMIDGIGGVYSLDETIQSHVSSGNVHELNSSFVPQNTTNTTGWP
eukprot:CAMPEP_0204345560 /NCGR_PEP_ID=MMETSP0469-20131031/26490_1 /ASSEMBLY_ACC=CAM_ASM_000384 /TAXON_ID=2969 /ORGANISM="Oxyrrhis marina" /LENGTH=210 /DNA_ID=CAMNT_0051331017 /DNA_START=22 /DNA_END=654 /DNA_ORIENTATION=-